MSYPKKVEYAVGDRKPNLVFNVLVRGTNSTVDGTGAVNPKFYLWNRDTGAFKLEDDTSGFSITTTNPLKITKVWQSGDLDIKANYLAWVTYEDGAGLTVTTRPLEVNVSEAYERAV